jgi:hypothetical protein
MASEDEGYYWEEVGQPSRQDLQLSDRRQSQYLASNVTT